MNDKPDSIWAVFKPHKGGGHPIVFASVTKTKGQEYIHVDRFWAEAEKRLQAEERLEALQAEKDALSKARDRLANAVENRDDLTDALNGWDKVRFRINKE